MKLSNICLTRSHLPIKNNVWDRRRRRQERKTPSRRPNDDVVLSAVSTQHPNWASAAATGWGTSKFNYYAVSKAA
jgi:hypothetical protein